MDQAKLDLIFVNATKTENSDENNQAWPTKNGSAKKTSVGSNDFIVCCMSVPAISPSIDNTASIVTALQVITAGVTFVYMSFWECSLKRQRSVHWEDMTTVIDDDEVHKKLVRLKNKYYCRPKKKIREIKNKMFSAEVP